MKKAPIPELHRDRALERGFSPSIALVDVGPSGGTAGKRVITRLLSLTPPVA